MRLFCRTFYLTCDRTEFLNEILRIYFNPQRKLTLPDDIKLLIQERNEVDIALYEEALNIFESRYAGLPHVDYVYNATQYMYTNLRNVRPLKPLKTLPAVPVSSYNSTDVLKKLVEDHEEKLYPPKRRSKWKNA